MSDFLEKIREGLVVSCYSGDDYNQILDSYTVIEAVARSVEAGGASGIRANVKHIPSLKEKLSVPVIGIKKVYQDDKMRITPTLKEVEEISRSGADAIVIDATKRERFDRQSLADYIGAIKDQYSLPLLADISTFEEGVNAAQNGVDAVFTTLAGYTPYSSGNTTLGSVPPPPPDLDLVKELTNELDVPVVAEGRYDTPEKVRNAFDLGAFAVVVGTAITNPKKITEYFVASGLPGENSDNA